MRTIARDLDLSPATVSQVTRRLIHQGVVEPLYFAPSEGGRPGQLLGLVADAGHAVGVKLAADHLILVDVRLDGHVLDTTTENFDALAADAIPRLLASLGAFVGTNATRLLGVGVCVPGVVEHPDVGDVDAEVLGWSRMPLGRELRQAIGVPVLIENDVKALAVAERLYGRGRSRRSFVVVTVGRGVGFACVNNGVLERGSHGGAGEVGHVVVSNNGPQCACGQRGCLEAYIGSDGLVAAAREAGLLKAGQGLDRLTGLADRGDPGPAGFRPGGAAPGLRYRSRNRRSRPRSPARGGRRYSFLAALGHGLPLQPDPAPAGLDARHPGRSRPMGRVELGPGAAAIVLATPFDRNGLAGQQRLQVLARLHGD